MSFHLIMNYLILSCLQMFEEIQAQEFNYKGVKTNTVPDMQLDKWGRFE